MKIFEKYYAEFASLIIFAVYLLTLAPSVTQIDSGELAAVQAIGGIAHPTGYPLFTIIGFLWVNLPLPFSKIFLSNLLSAIFVAASVTFFIKSSYLIINNYSLITAKTSKSKRKGRKEILETKIDNRTAILASVFGGFILAFSKSFWIQATSVEVYSLHLLLLKLIIYLLLKVYFMPDNESNLKGWLYTAFALALGFTNHMTTLLILPGFAWLYFNRNKFDNNSLLQIGKMLLVFVPVLILFYSYLPIRASSNPFLNWGNAVNFENIFRHISGTQYRVWLFSSFDSAGKQLQYFITSFPSEFAYIGLLPAIWGAINLFKNKKDIFWFWIINFSFTILYSINYDIHDIDSYFLLAFISVAAFASIGILHIFLLANSTAKYEKFLPHSVTIIVLLLVVINFKKNDNSNNYIFEDYTKTMINSVEENAVIFSYQWDYFLSASLYYQFVENYRRDVIIVDKELLRRSWYFNQLEACYPGLFKGLEKSKQVFTEQLQHFERDEPYNPQIIEQYYRDLMTNFVSEKLKEGEFYIGPELFDNEMKSGQFTLPAGTTLVPHLFLYKVVKENRYYEAPLPGYTFRETDFENKYTENLKNFAAIVHTNRALYELQFGFENKAALYTKKAVEISKNLRLPVQLQKLL